MCGIAGIFKVNGCVTSEDVAAVLKMLNAEVHRGPDDWGILLPDEALRYSDAIVCGEAEDLWPQVVADFLAGTMKRM